MNKKITSSILTLTMLASSLTGCDKAKEVVESISQEASSSSSVTEKAQLSTPADVTLTEKVVSWKAVDNASSYVVYIGDSEYTVTSNSFDFSSIEVEDGTTIKVKAISNDYKDSEVSLSVKYSNEVKSDTRVEFLMNLISENTSIDLSNPLTLLKYQEPLTAISRTITTYNVSQEELVKIATFAKEAMEELSALSYDEEIDFEDDPNGEEIILEEIDGEEDLEEEYVESPSVIGVLLSVASKYAMADLNATITLSLAKDLVAIMIINDVSENMEPNNGYAIKLNKVASYLCNMQDSDIAKIAKVLDFGTDTYKQISNKLATVESIETIEDYIAIKDDYLKIIKDNLPSYAEFEEIGDSIYNILSPFETESKALKRLIDYEIYEEYQNLDFALYVAGKIDANYATGALLYTSSLMSVASFNISALSAFQFDPVYSILTYAGISSQSDEYYDIYDGLANLFYNLDEIIYETVTIESEDGIDEEFKSLDVDFIKALTDTQTQIFGNIIVASGLNANNLATLLSSISGALKTDEEEAIISVVNVLQEVYDNANLKEVLPFVGEARMFDLVTLLAEDINPDLLGSLEACITFADVVETLGLDSIFDFTDFEKNFENYIGNDFFTFIDELEKIQNNEKSTIVDVVKFLLKKFDSCFNVENEYLEDNFAISAYPALVKDIVANVSEQVSTLKESYKGISELVTTFYKDVMTNYVSSVPEKEDVEVSVADIAELEKQFNIVLATDSQLKLSQDFDAAFASLEETINGKLETIEKLEVDFNIFVAEISQLENAELLSRLLGTGEVDILDDVKEYVNRSLTIVYDIASSAFDAFDEDTLNKLKADYLAILENDEDMDSESIEAASLQLDEYIAMFTGINSILADYDAETLTSIVMEKLEGYRNTYFEITGAYNTIVNSINGTVSKFVEKQTGETGMLAKFFAIEAPGMDSVTNFYEFLIAYSSEDYKASFKDFTKDNYDEVVALLKDICDLDDQAVATLDKYLYQSYTNVEYNEETEDYDYVEVITPYVSTIEDTILGYLALAENEKTFETGYNYIDMAIQLIQYQVLVDEENLEQ